MAVFDFYDVSCRTCGGNLLVRVNADDWVGFARRSKSYTCPACLAVARNLASEEIWTRVVSCTSILQEVNSALLNYFRQKPEKLRDLPPRKFEEFVAEILLRSGYDVELTPPSHDHGVDIIAIANKNLGMNERVLVQCKRFAPNRRIGIAEVQRMLGVLTDEGGTRALIATTSYFTREARRVEERNCWRLSLHDYEALKGWLAQLAARS